MITSATEARFKIVLPSANRALAEVVASATPAELSALREGKDLRSVLNAVLHDKLGASRSDQTLLEILKNAPVFKTLGNPAEQLKALSESLQEIPSLAAKGSKLQSILADVRTLDPAVLKKTFRNSGIVMESKIAAAATLLPGLEGRLAQLDSLLSQNRRLDAAPLRDLIETLRTAPGLSPQTQTPGNAAEAFEGLKQLQSRLESLISKRDVIHSPDTARLADTLESLTARSAPLSDVKSALADLYRTLLSSRSDAASPLLDAIESLLRNAAALPEPAAPLADLAAQVRAAALLGDAPLLAESAQIAEELAAIDTPEGLLVTALLDEAVGEDLKYHLLELSDTLTQLPEAESAPLRDPVDKLLLQIDYHQLLSSVSASTSLFLPFEWDMLEEGSIAFRKNRPDKFYCEINLTLKEYGPLDLLMGLYDGNQLEVQAHPESDELKTLIDENLPALRSALIEAGLTPRRLRIVGNNESSPSSAYEDSALSSEGGFEVTV